MATAITRTELARLRLRSHGLTRSEAGHPPGTPGGALARMFALQGQDLPGVLWSIGQRAPGTDLAQVRRAFDEGQLVRSWPLRGTLHVLAAEDLAWVLALTGQRSLASAAGRERQLGLDAAQIDVARQVAAGELAGGGRATRAELFAAFDRAGLSPEGQRGVHLLWHLAVEGLLVLGPFQGGEQCIVLTQEWIGPGRERRVADAARELTARYLTGRGPATVTDLSWWAKLPVTVARRALENLHDDLTELTCDGTTTWALTAVLDEVASQSPRPVLMLPGFDELLLGYSDRSVALSSRHAPLTVPGGNGIFKPTIVVDGRVVGLWSRRASARRVTVTFTPFDSPLAPRTVTALTSAAADYGLFHGLQAQVVMADPSPGRP